MRRWACVLAVAAIAAVAQGKGLTFSGAGLSPVSEKPAASTGLDDVYVLRSTAGVKAAYTASSDNVRWLRYNAMGGGYAEEIIADFDGHEYAITLTDSDMGYIIEDGDKRYYCWVVNYANHQLRLDALGFAEEQDCDRARLQLQGEASKITYYTITGQPVELSRQLEITYETMSYSEDTEEYQTMQETTQLASIDGTFGVKAPLCDTRFTLTGDRFLKAWGMTQSVESDVYAAVGVECTTTASQEVRENDNEQKVESDNLGGSAPAVVHFHAAVTDAAIFREWQLARDEEFELVDNRFQQLDLDYAFTESGTTYVRFVANNSAGTCEYVGDVYQVTIGESALLCPNAFSPGASEGVNDEWKVSYKSIVKYECHIFNRWGKEMFSSTDPAIGWDGKQGGKVVPAGVYYYVIVAEGSDGKHYKLSGDINILKSKANTRGPSSEE